MKDLAPNIFRQRLIIEGLTEFRLLPAFMVEYLESLSKELGMVPLGTPSCSHHAEFGWCCHMHWITSGVHMYTWENCSPLFFSVDIYTCKPFDEKAAVEFTKNFLAGTLIELEHRSA